MSKVYIAILVLISAISFYAGHHGASHPPKKLPTPPHTGKALNTPPKTPISYDQALIKGLLKEKLSNRTFTFSDVVLYSSEKQILTFDPSNPYHQAIRNVVKESTTQSIKKLNAENSPIKKLKRINEASRYFEDELLILINAHIDFSCEIPTNSLGKKQRSGYPDLLITHLPSSTKAYLDPKLFEDKAKKSSFRTFYYEPKDTTLKIQHTAIHFLIGIEHDGNNGNWTFTNYDLVDVSKLEIKLKAEFHSSNKNIYLEHLLVK